MRLRRVSRAAVREIVDLCGFDGAWFEECERANGALAPAQAAIAPMRRGSISRSTEHSLRCAQLGKRNLRVEFNLLALCARKAQHGRCRCRQWRGGRPWCTTRCTNEVLIWIEAKAHAPDLPKADYATRRSCCASCLLTAALCRASAPRCRGSAPPTLHAFTSRSRLRAHSVIVTRAAAASTSPIRVPSYVTVSLQRAVWADDDEHLLDQLDSIRMAVVKQNQRSPMAIVQFYRVVQCIGSHQIAAVRRGDSGLTVVSSMQLTLVVAGVLSKEALRRDARWLKRVVDAPQ
jgi:hypothetical protein